MTKDIGVGVIGLGMGANMLLINDDPTSRLQVRALCDSDGTRLQRLAAEHGIPHTTSDYRELVARPDVDVVGIYSPDHLHIDHIEAAVAAGKHVICTKPMVVSLAEARRVVQIVRAAGLKFLTGQTSRFKPPFMAAHKLFADGDLGRPLFAEAHYVHDMRPVMDRTPWRHENPQDWLYGGACHPIDLLRWFFGDVDEVFTYASCSHMDDRYPAGKHDNFLINLRFRSGVIARILAVYGLVEPPLPMQGLSIFGDKGSFVDNRLVLDKIQGQPELGLEFRREAGHGQEVLRYMRHFEDCLLKDKRPLIDEVAGAKVIATASACWDSIHTGLPAKVQPVE